MTFRKSLLAAGALFALAGGLAIAQTPIVPQVVNVGPTDLFQDVVGGVPRAGNVYATAAQIAGVPGYAKLGTLVTTNTYAFTNGVTDAFGHAAGTLAAIGLTTEPAPADGKRECFYLDQIVSALTWTANTGQTINANVPAASAAKIPNCITYVAASATWFASP